MKCGVFQDLNSGTTIANSNEGDELYIILKDLTRRIEKQKRLLLAQAKEGIVSSNSIVKMLFCDIKG